ncbi:hypothetical protein FJY90_03730 [Candidatus Gottesmanbacteria bacterium]|nr:hypothetical protein [Candidatus Gottesmanbacteria bacterium]
MSKTVYILFLLILVSTFLAGCSQAAKDKNILAMFDKQVITLEELEKEISELPEWQRDKYKDKAGKEEYLTLMAESRMVLQYANEAKLEKDPEIIRQTKEYEDELMVEELTKRNVDDKVKIIETDIAMYYDENKDDYVEPERIAVTEISLEDEAKSNEIYKRVTEEGEDFTDLAKDMSTKRESVGPGQGNEGKVTFSRDSYSQARDFVEKSFDLEIGKMTQIVQPIGEKTYYMIVRLDERIPQRQQELDEVRDRIQRIVEDKKKEELKKNWIDEIKTKKNLQVFADKIPETPKEELETEEGDESSEEKDGSVTTPPKPQETEKPKSEITKPKDQIILAKFDKQTITLKDLEKEISNLSQWQQDKYRDKEGKTEYLNDMIEKKLILAVANDIGMNKDPKIAKQTKEYRDQLMVKELVKREVDDKVKVEEADLNAYYEANKADYVEPEKVTATEITLEDEEKYNDIYKRITEDGEDFTALAKEMSEKGESMGPGQGNEGKVTFSRESFSQARDFVEKSFELEPGQIIHLVQPIGEKTYYMIVRLDERMSQRQKELDEVKDNVQGLVEREKKRELIDKWLERMKTEKKFKIFLDRIPESPKEEPKAEEDTKSAEEEPSEESNLEETTPETESPEKLQ